MKSHCRIVSAPVGLPGLAVVAGLVLGLSAFESAAEVEPTSNTAALMPRHGTVSVALARHWEESLAAGNGIIGALLAGEPVHDTLIVNHCKLWLPLGSREIVPDVGRALPEMRRIIGEKGYPAGHEFFLAKAREQGWDGKLVWTDPFHPGIVLKIDQPADGPITDYARVQDYSTGEVWALWRTPAGEFTRRMFVSRTDNVVVLKLTGPSSQLACQVRLEPVENALIRSAVIQKKNFITSHNVYVNGKGGYDAAVRAVVGGGAMNCENGVFQIENATSVMLFVRIQPWKTPLTNSDAWAYSPQNPEFTRQTSSKSQKAAPAYRPRWMKQLQNDLASLRPDYPKLFNAHAKIHGGLFERASLDLGASATERGMSSEALLDLARNENRLPAALLERMYDAGRYVFLCSAGPDTPPNLFGIWTGTWQPAWSGDYTLDTNLQLDIESALSGDMAEGLEGYFNLLESFLPDFRTNARRLYGCRGILSGSRASNTGLNLHWDQGWPGEIWTPGAPWLAHWFYDYYLYTGDKNFLRRRAVPWMKECALFYEDFLNGAQDAAGHYTFRPSFSAENGWADNSTQDISIGRELLGNLIAACETLGIERAGVRRWRAMLAKLPPYLINDEGQLQEWSTPGVSENNNHRHLMHLYGAFESGEFSEESDPRLFQAARIALWNRLKFARETSTHGYMHSALAATQLGLGNEAHGRLQILATGRSMYPSLVTAHEPGPRLLCDDGNGAIPQIVNQMVVQSAPGRLALLPAIPDALPRGTLRGTRARGQIGVNQVAWDLCAGTLNATLVSDIDQEITLVLPPGMVAEHLSVNGMIQPVSSQGVRKQGFKLELPKGKAVIIAATFHPSGAEMK